MLTLSVLTQKGLGSARKAIIELVNGSGGADAGVLEEQNTAADFLSSRSVDESMEVQYPGSSQ